MKNSVHFFLLALFFPFCGAFAQNLSQQDTILYLCFDAENQYKSVNSRDIDPQTLEWIPVVRYRFWDAHFYDGHPLRFISERKDLIDTVAIGSLKTYDLVTLDELREFMSKNYERHYAGGSYGGDYFNNLKHIYLVEKDEEKEIATITEVRLDVNIE